MNYEPRISIIMPVYNGANFMRDAIDSALNQTYHNYEIVVVNDGSSDNGETSRIAKSYGDKIRFIDRQENKGISYTLNEGIANMQGEYFTWLSHDDRYIPTKLEDQVTFLNSLLEEHPEIERERILLCAGTERIDIHGQVTSTYQGNINAHKRIRSKKEMIFDNLRQYGLSGCTVLIPKEVFEKFGTFDLTKRTVQDTDLWYRLIMGGCIFCFLDKAIVQSREHKNKTGNRLNDVFEIEKEEMQASLAKKMICDPEFDDYDYLTKISNYLLKMGYKNAPRIIGEYLRIKEGNLKYCIAYMPYAVAGSLYGKGRQFAKRVYWMMVNQREK